MKESKIFRRTVTGIITFWLFVFVFFPNIMVFIVSFMTRDSSNLVAANFTWANYARIFSPIYLYVLVESIKFAFITTIMCVMVAFPFAYIMASIKGNLKNILLLLVIVPFWTSALIRTYAIKTIITPNGILNSLLFKLGFFKNSMDGLNIIYTDIAVIIGLVYTLLPFMIIPMYSVMEKLDRRYVEAAKDLGATRFQTFKNIIIPLTAPGIVAGSLLVFLPALGLFYIPELLGGSKKLLLGNLIKEQFLTYRNWPFGAAVSIILTILMALLLLANYKAAKMSKNSITQAGTK